VAAEILRESTPKKKVAAMFVDTAFGAPIVERFRTLGFDNVHEVSFGGPSPDYQMPGEGCDSRLESKSDLAQRGEASPDDADALALTFAQHVAPIEAPQEPVRLDIFGGGGFSGLGGGWMR
jgi:hypothetical protein